MQTIPTDQQDHQEYCLKMKQPNNTDTTKQTNKIKWFIDSLIIIVIIILLFFNLIYLKKLNHSSKAPTMQFLSKPILFIWIGQKKNPYNMEKYKFPYKLLTNQMILNGIDIKLKAVQKADITRLVYIYQNGGIYSDLDNEIDYPCIINMLKDKEGLWFGKEQDPKWKNNGSNFFIYSSQKRNPAFLPIFDKIRNTQYMPSRTPDSWTGPSMLKTFPNLNVIDIKLCVKHLYHKTW